jgi:hypothetical protein
VKNKNPSLPVYIPLLQKQETSECQPYSSPTTSESYYLYLYAPRLMGHICRSPSFRLLHSWSQSPHYQLCCLMSVILVKMDLLLESNS